MLFVCCCDLQFLKNKRIWSFRGFYISCNVNTVPAYTATPNIIRNIVPFAGCVGFISVSQFSNKKLDSLPSLVPLMPAQ